MFLKVSSLVLSVFLLLQSINIHFKDVVNLDALMEHIEFHQSEYGDSLFSFFSKHYGNKMSEHQEHKEQKDGGHHKLPFKHTVCSDAGQFFLVNLPDVKLINSSGFKHQQPTFYYNNYSYLENSDIFEPPRIS